MIITNEKSLVIVLTVLMSIWCIAADQAPVRSAAINCSTYEFYNTKMTWAKCDADCQRKNGTLVCIETRDEWEFIKHEITNLTKLKNWKPSDDIEWFIGLKTKGIQWKWVNGEKMTWTRKSHWPWHPGQPSNRRNEYCVKIWSDHYNKRLSYYGSVFCERPLLYICEYVKRSTKDCQHHEKTSPSAATQTTIAIRSTTVITATESPAQTETRRQPKTTGDRSATKKTVSSVRVQTALASTTGIALATKTPKRSTSRLDLKNTRPEKIPHSSLASKTVHPTEKQESARDTKPKEEGFQITYLAITLAVILILLACILMTLYCCKIRKKGKNQDSRDAAIRSPVSSDSTTTTDINEITKGNSFVAFKMVHNNLADSRIANDKPVHESTAAFETFCVKTSLKESSATSESSNDSSQTNINMNEIEAPICSSEDDKKGEVVYATVNKAAKMKKGNQEPQITYADLASFNNNKEAVVNMPPPYQPVEYAEIISKKTSKKK